MTWREIETAPKGGTWVLVAGHIGSDEPDDEGYDLRQMVARYGGIDWFYGDNERYPKEYDTDGCNDEPILEYWETCYWDMGWRSRVWSPTHWQPLPDPPK